MSGRDLIAILPVSHIKSCPSGLSAISHEGFTAVLGSSSLTRSLRLTRRAMLKGSVKRQQWIEQLMAHGTVLPVLPGTSLKPKEVQDFLQANRAFLDQQGRLLAGKVQFQVTITWNPDDAMQHFECDTEQDLQSQAEVLRRSVGRVWESIGSEQHALPRDENTIANDVLLIDADQELTLDAAVETIDLLWSEGLRIRQIGPSPAVSFGSLGVKRFSAAQVAAAMQVFSFTDVPNAAVLAETRRSALKRSDPEHHERIKSAAALLHHMMESGRNPPPPLVYSWREGQALHDRTMRNVA